MLKKMNFAIFLGSGFSFEIEGEENELEDYEKLEDKYDQLWRCKLIELLQNRDWYPGWEITDPIELEE
jgi:hypothetical protein